MLLQEASVAGVGALHLRSNGAIDAASEHLASLQGVRARQVGLAYCTIRPPSEGMHIGKSEHRHQRQSKAGFT